jgi:hypothetical protein
MATGRKIRALQVERLVFQPLLAVRTLT